MMETILYVEDDLSLIDGLEYTLETNGYSVDNARTVKQALALFNSKSYQELLCKGWSHHLIHMTAVHLWQNGTLQL